MIEYFLLDAELASLSDVDVGLGRLPRTLLHLSWYPLITIFFRQKAAKFLGTLHRRIILVTGVL